MSNQNNQRGGGSLITITLVAMIVLLFSVLALYVGTRYFVPKEKLSSSNLASKPVLTTKPDTSIKSNITTTQTPIAYTAVFKGFKGGVVEKWHECKNIDCISSLMKDAGASADAIVFTELLYKLYPSDYGYLSQFQEHGVIDSNGNPQIDLGTVAFPDRANTNEVHYLLNGSPAFVSTEEIFKNEEIISKIKQDPLYSEAKNKYPNIDIVDASNPEFIENSILPNNNKRFIFKFELKNGCRTCNTEYFADIGFDFSLDGKFLKTTFLEIIKIIVPEEKWETFKNSDLGFSIKYPQMVYGVYRCSPDKPFYVPLKVFEDKENGIAYISEEFYYDMPWDNELNKAAGPCKKYIYSLESLKAGDTWLARTIKIQHIKNDNDLNKFIKDNYGSGCFAGKKIPWEQQKGVFEIEIEGGDELDLGTTVCPLNFTLKILYAPQKNKAMTVILGQECGFGTDTNSKSYKCYDEEMINSFRFE